MKPTILVIISLITITLSYENKFGVNLGDGIGVDIPISEKSKLEFSVLPYLLISDNSLSNFSANLGFTYFAFENEKFRVGPNLLITGNTIDNADLIGVTVLVGVNPQLIIYDPLYIQGHFGVYYQWVNNNDTNVHGFGIRELSIMSLAIGMYF